MADEETPGWARQLLAEVGDLKTSFEQRLDALNNSVKDIKKETRAIANRISNAEKRISDLEDGNACTSKSLKSLTEEVKNLQTKCINLEAQSKRNNLVILGLEEGQESGNPDKMIIDLLRHILELSDNDPVPEVERHHRSLLPRSTPPDPPRAYLVRMLRWSDRQKILGVVAKRKRLVWEGKPIRIFPDLPVEIKKKRAEYNDIRKRLRGTDIRYGLLYPARFIVTIEGVKHIYNNAAQATVDLQKRLPKIFD
ncbi:hypothetical protein WMY93_015891 [Mugilogobius chulae]|uniref:L1 transposable element RRM domain-containing protein n=1 Tax=Mugilogobius chulae TaxID=88201 RepID=A0AAW0NRG2_9GOBI